MITYLPVTTRIGAGKSFQAIGWNAIAIAMFATAVIGLNSAVVTASQQEQSAEKSGANDQEESLATIRGSMKLDSSQVKDLDWESMNGSLGQLIALRQPQFPENWQEMAADKRQAWLKTFYESEAGKKLQEANKKALEDRHMQEFLIRSEGEFIIYDVPKGRYELRIVGQKEVDEKTFVLQAYGQFDVGEVDELDFSNMRLEVLRLLKMGEVAPPVAGENCEGQPIALAGFRGKHVLLAFGNCSNPAFQLTTRALKEASQSQESAGKLSVLTVTVDEDVKAVAEFNQTNSVDWNCLNLGGWDNETLNNYGLKSVPSLWLIDSEGKVVLTGQQFLFELNRTKFSIAKLVDEAIAGRLKIGGEPDESKTPDESGQSDDLAPGQR